MLLHLIHKLNFAVYSNAIKTIIANEVSTVFINGKPTVINDLRRLKNPPF